MTLINRPFQRSGATSNADVGRNFELNAKLVLENRYGISLERNFGVPVGVGAQKKVHAFDLGCSVNKILVECKSHRWTSGNNVPSAKLTVWNEAMYYFNVAPENYRKILFVLHDLRKGSGESLASYYVRNYVHLIPDGVEIFEYDEISKSVFPFEIK